MRWSVSAFTACSIAIIAAPATALAAPADMPSAAQLTLQCLSASTAPYLRITLRNSGEKDVNLLLGISLGNGHSYHASALYLDVRGRGSDVIDNFQLTDSHPDIAGRVDPWILALPMASEFSMTRSLGDFSRVMAPLVMDRAPMDLRLRLVSLPQYRPRVGDDTVGPGLVHLMPGELQSTWIRVPEDCKPR